MSETPSRRAGLSPEKLELLRRRLGGDATAAARETVPRCAGPGPAHPMSFAQERMWFVSEYDPGNPMYNVSGAELLRADLDVDALRRALALVVRRHEGMRTVFRRVDGELRQVVREPGDVVVDVRDVRGRTVRAGVPLREEMMRVVAEEAARPFDLAEGPLYRVAALRVSDERVALVMTVHHIVTDGWSFRVMRQELDAAYGAYATGAEPDLPAPGLRYADYAVWQRRWLQGPNLQRQVDHWREQLADAPTLELPTDRPRPPQQSFRGRYHGFAMGATLARALRRVGQEEAATLNMVILAGIAALLSRWAEQDDLVVGTILANRTRPELEDMVGFLANTAALRLKLGRAPTFRDALRVARKAVLEADRHQDLPFEKLVEELKVERDPSRQPLFQVLYFHHAVIPAYSGADGGMDAMLDARPLSETSPLAAIDMHAARFDLMAATMEMEDGGVSGVLEYATDLFDAATMERFARHLVALLERATADPDLPLADLPLAEAAETARVLGAWNRTARELPAAPAHRLFERIAAERPDALALRWDGGSMTYAALDAHANRLARRLRAAGVRAETPVGVAMERGPDLVAALLAVWKAGGAYVPLDPAYPDARLAHMRRDAGVPLVLARHAADTGDWAAGARVLSLAEMDAADEDAAPLDVEVDPESLAYVVYTSGSTGLPKGTGVPHRAVVRLVRGQDFAPLGAGETYLHLAPVAFDASTLELWGPLLNGGTVALHPAGLPDPRTLGDFLTRHGVTVAWLTAGLFHRAVDAGLSGFGGLRWLLAGGDVLSPAHVARARALLPAVRLVNGYGPTETTTFASTHAVRDEDLDGRAIPIGRPIANTGCYVLDGRMRPAPVGVPGELYVGGPGVARGYLGRPGQTAAAFVPDPFGGEPGARLYRTGDRARWTAEGLLDFLGRRDGQVKLRGFRVETGEIESVLRAHPAVRDAAVVLRGEGEGRRLVAYVSPAAADAGAVRAHAATRLPEYMVPVAVVPLERLPLTPNGKVDRKALPEPDLAAEAPYVAPRTPTEEALSAVWAELLEVERVGATHSFFALGGHSVMAMRLAAAVEERLGVELPLRVVFEAPLLGDLAARVDRLRDESLAALLAELGTDALDDETRALLELG